METAIRLRTTVLKGNRIEITHPQLPEGADVELIVLVEEPSRARKTLYQRFLENPAEQSPQAVATWEEYEQLLREERLQWDG
ncbi:hypothetical protein HRbin15_00062 [bacterium HR15]|nr:hypothetical protein HRbin15_00062 [bacterium HR15]